MYQSPLRYPGGKRKSLSKITPYLPSNIDEYWEPFFGGGALFFYLINQNPHLNCWINDLNSEVYYFWEQVKNNLPALVEGVKEIKNITTNGQVLFKELSQAVPTLNIERAIRFFVLNRISFSGLVEAGGYSESAYEKRFTNSAIERLEKLAGCFDNTNITNQDYSEILNYHTNKNLFTYLDPPYLSKSHSRLYGRRGILHTNFDHSRFAQVMQQCQHRWLITYDDCIDVRRNFSFANIHEMTLQYGMNYQKGKELIITNY